MKKEIKEGWKIKTFESCLEKVMPPIKLQSKCFKEKGAYPIVSQEDKLISGYQDNEEYLVKHNKPIVIFGDHTRVVKYIDFDFIVGADGVKLLLPKDFLDSKFLYYFVVNANIKNLGYARHYRLLKELNIPLPPLSEQQRIVSLLDQEFTKIDAIREDAEKNLQNAKDLFQRTLEQMELGNDISKVSLKEITSKIGSGATPSGGRNSYISDGISLVRSLNVHNANFVYEDLAHINEEQANALANVELHEDDVLFNITGASVTRCCVLPKQVLPARVNQHVCILRPIPTKVSSKFLCLLLIGKYHGVLWKLANSKGATRQAITKAQLESFEIDLPSIHVQNEIINQIEKLKEKCELLQSNCTSILSNCQSLKQSLLRKAFNGEL